MQTMYDDRVKYKKLLLQQNKNMKILKNLDYSKILQSITISNLQKRFLSTLRMVLLGIIGFVITICWSLKQLLLLVSYPFVGLSLLLMSILMVCLRPITKIISLPQIQIQYMSFLTRFIDKVFKTKKEEGQDTKRIISFLDTVALEINLNLLLIRVIRVCISM